MIDFVVGVFELLLSLFLGILTAWFAYKRFSRLTRDIDEKKELRKNNVAVGILLGATILSVAFVVKQAAYPAVSSLQTMVHKGISIIGALKVLGVAACSIAIAMIIALAAIWVAVRIFLRLTKEINELAEIRRNNVAVAIVLGCLIVVIGLFLAQGIQSLLAALIPMPAFEKIQVM
jgi:uncharacterized membrane protein YjfL (UPF0719 family)